MNKIKKLSTEIRFQLFAQNRNHQLMIKNLKEENFFMRTAEQVLKDEALFPYFREEDIKIIRAVLAEVQQEQ